MKMEHAVCGKCRKIKGLVRKGESFVCGACRKKNSDEAPAADKPAADTSAKSAKK